MFQVFHNNFGLDTYFERSDRLRVIAQFSNASIAALSPPQDLADWMIAANDEFNGCRPYSRGNAKSPRHKKYRQPFTIAGISAAYQPHKRLIQSEYAGLPELLCEFDVHLPFPTRKAAALERVRRTIETLERHAAEHPEAPAMPATTLPALRAIVEQNEEYHGNNGEAELERRRRAATFKVNWERDTNNLRRLYSLWKAVQPEGMLVHSIGFREERHRRAGMPPVPENVRVEGGILKWDAAERATSYQVSVRRLGVPGRRADKKFTEHYGGESTECPAPPAPCIVKVRARNANGFGKYSEDVVL